MTMWRVYFNQRESWGGGKVYLCERPGYWMHWCSDPADCLPFTKEQAERKAAWCTKYCGDVNGECYIEEYEEARPLSIDNKGNYKASWYTHLLCDGLWKPLTV